MKPGGRDPRFQLPRPGPGNTAQPPRPGQVVAKQKDMRPPLYKPVRAGVLGVDPGRLSGYALVLPIRSQTVVRDQPSSCAYTLAMHGETLHPAPELFTEASRICAEHRLPLMVTAERWQAGDRFRDPTMTPNVIAGLGRAWGRWDMCRELAGTPASRVARCFTYEWHRVLGPGEGTWKERAQRHCYLLFGVELGPDAAEATCMALWGLHSARVEDMLPKTRVG